MKYGLENHTVTAIQGAFKAFIKIDKVILYGSRALNSYRNGSDIDLTIIGIDISIQYLQQIELELEELMLPYQIDLSIFNHIGNKNLIEHIQRVGIEFYTKE